MAVRKIKTYDYKSDPMTGKVTTTARLFADDKSDIKDGMSIDGLPDGNYELKAGSDVYTSNGDIGILKSDGDWNWIGED